MTTPIRLDKRVCALLQCSRAQAQQYIEGGWVSVDGVVVETPQTMVTGETVTVASEASAEAAEPATLLLNKPAGASSADLPALLTEANHFEGDYSGIRPLRRHFLRLEALMPLDDAASGLVVFTQDWRIRRHLLETGHTLEQEYVVEVSGEPTPWAMPKLTQGLIYQNRSLPGCKVSWQSEQRLRLAIKDVRPGQLAWMCAQVGLKAEQIRRLRIGQIGLSKMPEGQWRYLPATRRF
ncbi:RNA-binding protein [Stenotrophomonas pictorum JCM 9942]|uniref:Dual-specificity RNA pseudouridine synthase RluF n=2 Tax=Stenotrophomonas pictorum TaxID=86184 RepID=A0A0R0AMQ0_9GAMM|nr:rRNA pseudouridine synthase [Stenotrophomonas pictorum]KRG41896.1 RNA-binding protein [Stenotrophomonas pictorum JCM 9942]